jgi:hypothetical protein
MFDLLAPISESTTRTQSTFTNGFYARYRVGVEGAEIKAKRR